MFLETPELITKYAGNCETHKITTKDGYLLTMFRIPRENPKAFLLWKAGYDVWLNNQRGTLFSEDHTNSSISNFDYWNFSFHEVAVYDIPSQIDLMKRVTKSSNIIFIGHSQGSSSGLIYAALKNQHAKNSIKLFILMALPCYFEHNEVLRFLPFIVFPPLVENLIRTFQMGSVLPFLTFVVPLSKLLLSEWTPELTEPSLLKFDPKIYFKNYSWKMLAHYLQLISTKTRFQMFDYGKRQNLERYHSEVPPLYPIENVSVPVYLVSSVHDSMTTLKDADLLFDRLPDSAKVYGKLDLIGLNHADYFAGKRAVTLYNKLLDFIDTLPNDKEPDVLIENLSRNLIV
ncbi:unnamed protein product [Tenebrio molitor]|nr:unnamed protein product [Tenebrio molitor]